jgi:hypothetical protein
MRAVQGTGNQLSITVSNKGTNILGKNGFNAGPLLDTSTFAYGFSVKIQAATDITKVVIRQDIFTLTVASPLIGLPVWQVNKTDVETGGSDHMKGIKGWLSGNPRFVTDVGVNGGIRALQDGKQWEDGIINLADNSLTYYDAPGFAYPLNAIKFPAASAKSLDLGVIVRVVANEGGNNGKWAYAMFSFGMWGKSAGTPKKWTLDSDFTGNPDWWEFNYSSNKWDHP